jgi:hypothetical protein
MFLDPDISNPAYIHRGRLDDFAIGYISGPVNQYTVCAFPDSTSPTHRMGQIGPRRKEQVAIFLYQQCPSHSEGDVL